MYRNLIQNPCTTHRGASIGNIIFFSIFKNHAVVLRQSYIIIFLYRPLPPLPEEKLGSPGTYTDLKRNKFVKGFLRTASRLSSSLAAEPFNDRQNKYIPTYITRGDFRLCADGYKIRY